MKPKVFIVLGSTAVLVAGCNAQMSLQSVPDPSLNAVDQKFVALAPQGEVEPQFLRYEVADPTGQPPGTIVVDTKQKFLYFVLPNKRAIRYGVSVGKEGYGWTGTTVVQAKREWPSWQPPAEMLQRWPHLKPYAGGLQGGPNNPLGARALYLYAQGMDTLYRIHGTTEPDKIGREVSSGCIRMRNIDVIDLYNRVKIGTKVQVVSGSFGA